MYSFNLTFFCFFFENAEYYLDMCGIVGVNERNEPLITESAGLFRYRGPDAFGIFADDEVTLGHNRLSIIDLDQRSNQPMWDEAGEVVVVFNGEIYNFKELKEKLSGTYHFRTTSDTEVLLYLYREYGEEMTCHLHGMYAFAIYDTHKKKIYLFRDHAGIKPLYYTHHDGLFAFSSELKGLTHILKEKHGEVRLNQEGIDMYTVLGYIPSPTTLYKDIVKIERSSFLIFDLENNRIEKTGSFIPKVAEVREVKTLANTVEQSILSHLVADVPVGVFFSGGTDSSLIAAVLHTHHINLDTFSIRLKGKKEDEKYFKLIAQHLGIKAHVFDFDVKEFDDIYNEVMEKLDEPLSDNSLFPTYYLSKQAARSVKVILSGEGGDEYFYGYPRSKVLSGFNPKKCDFKITALDRLYFTTPSFFGKNRLFERLFQVAGQPISYYLVHMSPARDLATLAQWRRTKEEFRRKGVLPMAFDQVFYLENDPLRKTDLATSYNSIEGRVPLLDSNIVLNAPYFARAHLDGGILKASLKKILARYLPAELVYRGKSGFGMDMRSYFRKSKYLKPDLHRALAFLSERKVIGMKWKEDDIDRTIEKYPNYCLSLVSLYHAIQNNERY